MEKQITIKRINSADLADAAKVYSKAWQASHKGIVDDDYLAVHSTDYKQDELEIKGNKACNEIHLLRDNGIPVGIAILNIEQGEITSLYISPEYWGKGYGKVFLDFAADRLKHFDSIFLTVMNKNARARRFYEKYGFEYTGEEKILSVGKGISELKYIYATV